MTDKEKEAIEILRKLYSYQRGKAIPDADDYIFNKEYKATETVLNLIQTQQEEIEALKMKLAENIARTVNSDLKKKYKHEDDLEALHLGWKEEIEKKEALIHTMQAEFERLENLEDNTDMLKEELKKKDKIINNSINEIEKIRQYFSEDLQVEFIRILEILKDKKVIDW